MVAALGFPSQERNAVQSETCHKNEILIQEPFVLCHVILPTTATNVYFNSYFQLFCRTGLQKHQDEFKIHLNVATAILNQTFTMIALQIILWSNETLYKLLKLQHDSTFIKPKSGFFELFRTNSPSLHGTDQKLKAVESNYRTADTFAQTIKSLCSFIIVAKAQHQSQSKRSRPNDFHSLLQSK
ncbi:hypothetical protein BDF20DRAFT_984239 [Mycotypha africana]|uniref:uncharacterized protein n=1 Tax=Mycotypha africana TaxID=64632 RepID=UPI0023004C9C|nr:uncharacterized protein BDF20DRAFT_984239 [Mycotypha africana]KAI8991601.1 hypothetical protein BDF20DRAFT_984239 [Mycotypha africana]